MTAPVRFWWDPMCPFAWITSRWVNEVARQTGLDVEWRFISLGLLNEHRNYDTDFPAGYVAGHGSGLKLLRVAAAIREAEGPERMGALYTQFGGDVHVRGRRAEIVDHYEDGFPDYLRSVGIEEQYVAEANNPAWDDLLRAEKDELPQGLAAAQLTPREIDVLKRLCLGMANKEIARALALSPRTVETHRAHLSEKLQAESLAQLIRRYGTLVDEAARP